MIEHLAAGGNRDLAADQFLDRAEKRHFVGTAEGNCRARTAGTRRPADTMHIALRIVGHVVVEDVGDARDVDAARGDVGRNQVAQPAGTEGGKHPLALRLALVAVDRLRGHPRLPQDLDELVGAVLGAGKDEGAVDRLGAKRLGETARLVSARDEEHALVHLRDGRCGRSHADADRIGQHLFGKAGDLGRHGGREKERLPLPGEHRDETPDIVDEAHVEHPVGLVEDEEIRVFERDRPASAKIDEPSRGGHQDIDALREVTDLAADRDAADDEGDLHPEVAPIQLEAIGDLAGEFSGRAQHQHAAALLQRAPMVEGKSMENGQGKSGRLAGSGLRHADEVSAGKGDRYGGSLNRCRGRMMRFGEGTSDGLGDAERRK